MAERRPPVVTLLTDFGLQDYFVAAMKGVIYDICPEACVVDITHLIPPHDVIGAAFTLGAVYHEFPRWTVHVVVVDPGVGTARRPIVVVGDQHYFVGPDNGVFSVVYEREPYIRVYHLTEEHFFRPSPSATFHGRDIFAPVAAWLARGVEPVHMGVPVEDFIRLKFPKPVPKDANVYQGIVLHVDRFGNLVTNFDMAFLASILGEDLRRRCQVILAQTRIPGLRRTFGEVPRGELVAYIGSAGFLEIAIHQGNAAQTLKATRGTEVSIVVAPES